MIKFKDFLLPSLVVGIATISGTALAGQRSIAGEYLMQGKGVADADRAYTGTCMITGNDALYDVSCYNSDTQHTYIGKGIRTGDYLATLIGDLLKGDHGNAYHGEYLTTYTIAADGKLTGRWVHAVSAANGNETLTPKK